MIKALFRRFGLDQRGVMGMLAICAAIPLTLLMFYTVNTSKALLDKTRAQDAADMIALVHAAEGARSLNTISMNQVSMTQAFSTGSTAGSLIATIVIHDLMLIAAVAATSLYMVQTCKKWANIPWVGAALAAICAIPSLTLIGELLINAFNVNEIFWKWDPHDSFDTAKKSILALNAINNKIVNRYPEAVEMAAKKIAKSANVTDIYFDQRCTEGETCDQGNKRQGMNLPIEKDIFNGALSFCAAMHVGSIGAGASIPALEGLGNMSSMLEASFLNGSYVKRKFPFNKGPMMAGNDDFPHLRDYVDATTRIGTYLNDYYDLAHDKNLFDGLLNPVGTIASAVDAAGSTIDALEADEENGPTQAQIDDAENQLETSSSVSYLSTSLESKYGLNYPWEQKTKDNIYTVMQNIKIVNICANDPIGSVTGDLGVGGISGFTDAVFPILPAIHHYHPRDIGIIPKLPVPSLEDYTDYYRPLAMVKRKSNKRWAPTIFKDSNEAFFTYGQSLLFNPDEMGLYSQNWQSRLIPATKMRDDLAGVLSRMDGQMSPEFQDMKDDLGAVQDMAGWSRLVAK